MVTKREKLNPDEDSTEGSYFKPESSVSLFPSGSQTLDCVLGGGWAGGRIINVVGDSSTGKTLLAIEAAANFDRQYKEGGIYYSEAESAFDEPYAEALGFPVSRVNFGEPETIEDVFEELEDICDKYPESNPACLYILDSLDALSDRGELEREIDDKTYGMGKAKALSQLFRRLVSKLGNKNITLFIISQIRENIGVTFGKRYIRAGGKSLQFYSSQIIYLAHMKMLTRQIKNVERPIGIQIKAKCEKNKIGLPFRTCEFPLIFGFGIDDLRGNLEWLQSVKRLDKFELDDKSMVSFMRNINKLSDTEYIDICADVAEVVKKEWDNIEQGFAPGRKKYL